jgi:hypothetical protein
MIISANPLFRMTMPHPLEETGFQPLTPAERERRRKALERAMMVD